MNKREKKFLVITVILTVALAFGCSKKADTSAANVADNKSSADSSGTAPQSNTTAAPSSVTTGSINPVSDTSPKSATANQQTANTPERQIGSGGNDFFLYTKIRGLIMVDEQLKNANIIANVNQGIVTLTGAVACAAEQEKAEQIARSQDGVKSVKN